MFFFYNFELKIAKLLFINYLCVNKTTIANIKLFFKRFKVFKLANIFLK